MTLQVARSTKQFLDSLAPSCTGTSVIIGNLDGVHRGHLALVESAVAARGSGECVAALTFSPHPQEFFSGSGPLPRLTPDDEKFNVLGRAGVECTLVLNFDAAFAGLSAEGFFDRVLVRGMNARSIHVGQGFRFGHNREGDEGRLMHLALEAGVRACIVDTVMDDGARISSTRIRQALEAGEVAQAAQWLGRPYALHGPVVRGAGRGKRLGIATANLKTTPTKQVPRLGVYASQVPWQGTILKAVTNIGVRPTFGRGDMGPSIETHILDFDQDVYGQWMSVELLHWLREEQRFKTVDDLKAQVLADIAARRAR